MPIELTDREARVIGCLMEKSKITPDQYPLTLNALTSACNQKSSRDPVLSLTPGEVQHTIRSLMSKHLVRTEENFKTQVEKYTQRLCNTPFSDHQLDDAQFAIICVLLLRGPRTPGELRANVGRLHAFADNDEVLAALETLIHPGEGPPLVVELPRSPGRRDPEYAHLLGGPLSVPTPPPPAERPAGTRPAGATAPALEPRVAALESEVSSLKAELTALRTRLDQPG